jgi:hypothetical protein
VDWVVQGFMGFMIFNAVVVFGEGVIRWLGLGASLLLAGMWVCQTWRAKKKTVGRNVVIVDHQGNDTAQEREQRASVRSDR